MVKQAEIQVSLRWISQSSFAPTSLKQLIIKDKDIATTHALFTICDQEINRIIEIRTRLI